MVSDRVTAAAIAAELGAAREWARQQNVTLEEIRSEKLVRAVFAHEDSGEQFFLQGQFDGYKELPPLWQWCDSDWSDPGNKRLSPNAEQTPFGSSLFLDDGGKAIICAPFNRLAHKAYGGPHKNWGELSDWMNPQQGSVYAVTIADMLDVIARDLRHSTGRMA